MTSSAGDRVERGYLLLPVVFEREASGELKAAAATAGEAAAIGQRFGDSDLFALAAHEQGHVLIKDGQLKEGLALLDEAMVAVTAGELSPIVSGIAAELVLSERTVDRHVSNIFAKLGVSSRAAATARTGHSFPAGAT